jgi:hypothetical protein
MVERDWQAQVLHEMAAADRQATASQVAAAPVMPPQPIRARAALPAHAIEPQPVPNHSDTPFPTVPSRVTAASERRPPRPVSVSLPAPVGPPTTWDGPVMARPAVSAPPLPAAPPATAETYARAPVHGDPAWRRVGRVVGRVAGLSTAAELREHTDAVSAIQASVTTCRRIAVFGLRGGCGKSSISALVSLAVAAHRSDGVLAVDADSAPGSLGFRLGAAADLPRWTPAVGPLREHIDATAYLARTHHNLRVLTDPENLTQALMAFNRFFAVAVIDAGTALARGAASDGQWHALVYVTPATVDGIRSARANLEAHADSGVLSRTVIVLSQINPHTGGDPESAARALSVGGATILLLPYDRHLAAGAAIQPAMLAESTRMLARRIAALSLAHALSTG